MGLFDNYFDPDQFEASGGLVGRLMSLQRQQGQYQPAQGVDGPSGQAGEVGPAAVSGNAVAQVPPIGPTSFMKIGDYLMPQFGSTDASETAQPPRSPEPTPGLGDRLATGFQSWAHTPVGNPFAALANGMAGFGAGQRADASGLVPSQAPAPAQTPDLGGRLNAGFQSWAHTAAGNPFAALANGIAAFDSGQRINSPSMPQESRSGSEASQSPSPVIPNATLAPMKPPTANRSAPRAMAGPIMPRANPWRSRYGR